MYRTADIYLQYQICGIQLRAKIGSIYFYSTWKKKKKIILIETFDVCTEMLVLSGTLQLVVILTATSITTGLPTDISETASGVTAGLPRDISETASGVTAGLPTDISETASSVTDGLPTDIRETVVNSRETDKTEKQIERFGSETH